MGMFDSVMVVGLTCSACGRPYPDEVEVQFKVYVGRAYSPDLAVVRVGERIPRFPPVPALDEWGCWNCAGCDHLGEVRVRIERGVVAWVRPFERDGDGYPVPPMARLPRPKNAERRRRREVAVDERLRRERAEDEVRLNALARDTAAGLGVPSDFVEGATVYATLASSMTAPLCRRLDYASIARRIFLVEPVGTRRVGPYRKEPGGWWGRAA